MRLTTHIHDRDVAGLRYVYPVVSRRAGGVSVGVNLNPNKACNWRCAYCQVQGLVRGAAPEIDLAILRNELDGFLAALVHGDYMERHVPEGSRRINDVAFSGDGEATTSRQFPDAVRIVRAALERVDLLGPRAASEDLVRVVLITNGSMVHRPEVQDGLVAMNAMNGEVWYKLDSATGAGRRALNDAEIGTERVLNNLVLSAGLCRTRVQTMALAIDGEPPSRAEQEAYIELLCTARERGAEIADVLLYGLERTSYQPEAERLSKLSVEWLEAFADDVRARDFAVSVHP